HSTIPHRSPTVQVNITKLIDEVQCYQTVRELRWLDGVQCPSCESQQVIKRGFDDTGSWCRFALSPFVCHAADWFRRRASWYSFPCFVLTVIAIKSSKAARPKRVTSVISARTPPVRILALSVISSTKALPLRSKSRSWI